MLYFQKHLICAQKMEATSLFQGRIMYYFGHVFSSLDPKCHGHVGNQN